MMTPNLEMGIEPGRADQRMRQNRTPVHLEPVGTRRFEKPQRGVEMSRPQQSEVLPKS